MKPAELGFNEYLRVIKDRKWIIILATLVTTISAVVYSMMQPPVYIAATKVLIAEDPNADLLNIILPSSEIRPNSTLETQLQLMQLIPVAQKVVSDLGLKESPEELLGSIEVRQIGRTSLVEIQAQNSNPKMAKQIADAFAQAFMSWSTEYNQARSEDVVKEIGSKMQDIKEDILLLGQKMSKVDDAQRADLKLQLDLATNLYAVMAEKHEQYRLSARMRSSNIGIAALAQKPSSPISPKPKQSGVLALLAGLILGIGFAFSLEYLDDTIKTKDDINKYHGLSVLGEIPHNERFQRDESIIISRIEPQSLTAEAYKAFRTNIMHLHSSQNTSSILIASGSPSEGKSSVVANLATVLGQAGKKVIVISADLRRPKVEKMFRIKNTVGLSNVLAGEISFEKALRKIPLDGVCVLPSGPTPPYPSELLGSLRMDEVIRNAKKMADIVLIDTAPTEAVTDGVVLAPKVDGVILIVSSGEAKQRTVENAREKLENVGANVLGIVLNNIQLKREGYYYYHHHYPSNQQETFEKV